MRLILLLFVLLLTGSSVGAVTNGTPSLDAPAVSESRQVHRKVKLADFKIKPSVVRKIVNSLTFADAPDPAAKMDGLAIAGFVCAVVGIFFAGIILGTVGVVLSSIAYGNIKSSGGARRGKGLALAGLIIGLVAIIGAAIVLGAM